MGSDTAPMRPAGNTTGYAILELVAGILGIAEDAVISVDETYRITMFNQGGERVFGYSSQEVLGQPLDLVLPEYFWETHRLHVAEVGESEDGSTNVGERQETYGRRKDRSEFPAEVSISDLDLGEEKIFTVMVRDVTERKRADEALRSSEARFAGILSLAEDAVISVDEAHRITTFNQGAEGIFGYASHEAIGQPLDLLLPERFSEIHSSHIVVFGESGDVSRKIGERREVCGRRKDGSEFPGEASISKFEQGGEKIFTVMLRDISLRKQADNEIRSLNSTLKRHADHLATANRELEAFSYSVSHDLRAPLRHIHGFADLLQKHSATSLDEIGRHYVKTISDSAKQMGRLIDDLLTFSHMSRSDVRTTAVNLSHLAREVIQELEEGTGRQNIVWQLDPLPDVEGDAAMLRLVWVNLLSNAVKYTGTRSEARIEIGSKAHQEEIVFFVRDNGVGFDMQYADKLFGVFQRLHRSDEFEGTGIGLANVQRIIHRHGGRTWGEGVVDGGATFYFTLPRTKGETTK
ncbi:MAG: PAS domain S-box protein [Acidobacteriota bacterium]